jgi:hypothetical protein
MWRIFIKKLITGEVEEMIRLILAFDFTLVALQLFFAAKPQAGSN